MSDPAPEFWSPSHTPTAPPSERPPGLRTYKETPPLLLTAGLALMSSLLTRHTGGTLGLNVLLMVAALIGMLLVALQRRRGTATRPALLLLALGGTCAVGLTLNAGTLISGLNVLGLLTALTLGTAYLRFPGVARLGVGHLLLTLVWGGLRGFFGLPLMAAIVPWERLRTPRLMTRARAPGTRRVLTGLLLTVPLLLVFGALLGAADARFGALTSALFEWRLPAWNIDELTFSLLQLLCWAFAVGGLVYAALMSRRPAPQPASTREPTLTLTEVGIPLLGTSLLFCVYLVVQSGTFFGRGLVNGLTYSEYARRGFGELTAVAALTLVVLLLAHTLLRRELRHTLHYRLLSLAVLLPLACLIVSAYLRLDLYVQAYGLSESRVLDGVFLAWVVLSLALYTVLLWRGGLERFAYFSLISGLGLIVGLNVVNPGRLIASTNLSRTQDMKALIEAANLGPDALPVLLHHLSAAQQAELFRIDTPEPSALVCALAGHNARFDLDWRVWNLARRRAAALMARLETAFPSEFWQQCRVNYDDV